MPNWKKVIVSGSNASLNSLELSGSLTVTGSLTAPNTSSLNRIELPDNAVIIASPSGHKIDFHESQLDIK